MSRSTAGVAPPADTRNSMSVRDELRELTRQRLLRAARALFERDGYVRSTISHITHEANVSRATFYLHFADKADILLALRQADLADAPRYWRDVDVALASGARDAVRVALGNTLIWYRQHGALLPLLQEAIAAEPGLARQTEGTWATFAAEMTGYLDAVAPQERERAHLRLQMLMIQLHQIAVRIVVRHQRTIDPELLLDELTEIWMLVLLPRPAVS